MCSCCAVACLCVCLVCVGRDVYAGGHCPVLDIWTAPVSRAIRRWCQLLPKQRQRVRPFKTQAITAAAAATTATATEQIDKLDTPVGTIRVGIHRAMREPAASNAHTAPSVPSVSISPRLANTKKVSALPSLYTGADDTAASIAPTATTYAAQRIPHNSLITTLTMRYATPER